MEIDPLLSIDWWYPDAELLNEDNLNISMSPWLIAVSIFNLLSLT
jgi:hypothetical protein